MTSLISRPSTPAKTRRERQDALHLRCQFEELERRLLLSSRTTPTDSFLQLAVLYAPVPGDGSTDPGQEIVLDQTGSAVQAGRIDTATDMNQFQLVAPITGFLIMEFHPVDPQSTLALTLQVAGGSPHQFSLAPSSVYMSIDAGAT